MIIVIQEVIENSDKHYITLNLEHNPIGDEGVRLLSLALKKKPISPISTLILNYTNLTDLGAKYLAEMLEVNTTLTDLALDCNRLTDQGVRLLLNALLEKNRTLSELSLVGHCSVTDESIAPLCRLMRTNPTLVTVAIYGCNWSQEGLRRLTSVAEENEILLRGWRHGS